MELIASQAESYESWLWRDGDTLYHIEHTKDGKWYYIDQLMPDPIHSNCPDSALTLADQVGLNLHRNWRTVETKQCEIEDIDAVINNPLPYFIRLFME